MEFVDPFFFSFVVIDDDDDPLPSNVSSNVTNFVIV